MKNLALPSSTGQFQVSVAKICSFHCLRSVRALRRAETCLSLVCTDTLDESIVLKSYFYSSVSTASKSRSLVC